MNIESGGIDGLVAKKADTTEKTRSPTEGMGKIVQKDYYKLNS